MKTINFGTGKLGYRQAKKAIGNYRQRKQEQNNSSFSSTLLGTINFARTVGAKDKQPRKKRGDGVPLSSKAEVGSLLATGGLGAASLDQGLKSRRLLAVANKLSKSLDRQESRVRHLGRKEANVSSVYKNYLSELKGRPVEIISEMSHPDHLVESLQQERKLKRLKEAQKLSNLSEARNKAMKQLNTGTDVFRKRSRLRDTIAAKGKGLRGRAAILGAGAALAGAAAYGLRRKRLQENK